MDRMRARRPTMRPLPADAPKPTYEDFKPETEWSQDSSNHILHIHLPGFKREEIRVQVEDSGKLIVTGTRKVAEDKFISVDQSFPVPKDAIIEKIVGRLQNGYLTLIMPIDKQKTSEKRDGGEPSTEEKPKSDEQKKDEAGIQKKPESSTEKKDEPTKSAAEKKDEPLQKEMPKSVEQKSYEDAIQRKDEPRQQVTMKSGDERKDEPTAKIVEKKSYEDAIQKKTESEEKRDEPRQQEMPKSGDENKDEPTPKEMPKSDEKQEPKNGGKSTAEDSIRKEEKEEQIYEEEKEEDTIQREKLKKRAEEAMEKMSKKAKDGLKKAQGSRKRGPIWKDGEDGWLDYGLMDALLEKMHRNKKEIAVAVVAFSIGFYVAHKMKTSGK